MELGKEILTIVVTSSLVSGIFIFVIKQYASKWIANEFEERLLKLNYKIKKAEKVDMHLLDGQIGIYPELIMLTNKLKNILVEGLKKDFAYEWDPKLRPLSAKLTEDLYNNRYFISVEVFEKLHKFKHIVQDAILLVDMHTRENMAFDKELYIKANQNFRQRSMKLRSSSIRFKLMLESKWKK